MAIALRNTSNVGLSKSTGGTLSVPVPTGTVSGDVLLIAVTVGSSSTLPATPSGLTALDSGTTGPSYGSWYRICDGTEPASYSFTVTKPASATARSYSGANTTTPINAHGTPNKTATASATATSITTTTNGCEIVFFNGDATSGLTFTLPTGFANTASNTTGISSVSCDKSQTTAGATGTVTGTWSGANNNWSQLIALAPASGATANTLTASPGAMTITGDAITPPVAHKPTVNPGAMTITGSAVTPPVKHAPTLNPGTMALSGHAALLPVAHKPTLSPTSYVITGDATTLVVSHIFVLSVSPGAMSITGDALLLPVKRGLSAVPGTFTISGDAVTFTTSSGKPALNPTPGPYKTGADIHGFNPFPGTARIPGAGCFTGPLSQWVPYHDVMMIAYDYANQLFQGTRDKSCLQALANAGIGGKV